ncbi:hypothetical protein HPB50_020449 [Hyalomma asiaticum]|uniref:Uncharacterized protein n=1 Tax=Hyalomma asiaticum TaxID=266040 RepID=A0ACB7S2M2_HYAAI|nr:hypothetical protein HPB50_020449 [Hyalomma asiaticum]
MGVSDALTSFLALSSHFTHRGLCALKSASLGRRVMMMSRACHSNEDLCRFAAFLRCGAASRSGRPTARAGSPRRGIFFVAREKERKESTAQRTEASRSSSLRRCRRVERLNVIGGGEGRPELAEDGTTKVLERS